MPLKEIPKTRKGVSDTIRAKMKHCPVVQQKNEASNRLVIVPEGEAVKLRPEIDAINKGILSDVDMTPATPHEKSTIEGSEDTDMDSDDETEPGKSYTIVPLETVTCPERDRANKFLGEIARSLMKSNSVFKADTVTVGPQDLVQVHDPRRRHHSAQSCPGV